MRECNERTVCEMKILCLTQQTGIFIGYFEPSLSQAIMYILRTVGSNRLIVSVVVVAVSLAQTPTDKLQDTAMTSLHWKVTATAHVFRTFVLMRIVTNFAATAENVLFKEIHLILKQCAICTTPFGNQTLRTMMK